MIATMARRTSIGVLLLLLSGRAAAQAPATIGHAAWLAGCWVTQRGSATIEEQWMAPAGGTMLGMGRTIREGRLDDYELMLIRARDGRVDYEAHPMMQPTAVFTATVISDTLLQFENPRHDFPRLIAYQRRGRDSLAARIAAGPAPGDKQVLIPYRRVACAGTARHSPRALSASEYCITGTDNSMAPARANRSVTGIVVPAAGASCRLSIMTCRPRPIRIALRRGRGRTGIGRMPCPGTSVCSIAAPAGEVTATSVSAASPWLLISIPTVTAFTSAAPHATACFTSMEPAFPLAPTSAGRAHPATSSNQAARTILRARGAWLPAPRPAR